jgi:DNA-binding transcriptional regulator GbsR (MarR family)
MHRDAASFIERCGVHWEKDGLPRIAGRIFGLTLISPDPCSLDDIADALGVSKASVSNDARMLEQLGLVERVSLPGDRKVYYQITSQSIERSLETRLQRINDFQRLMDDAKRIPMKRSEVRERIETHSVALAAVTSALGDALTELKTRRESPATRRI